MEGRAVANRTMIDHRSSARCRALHEYHFCFEEYPAYRCRHFGVPPLEAARDAIASGAARCEFTEESLLRAENLELRERLHSAALELAEAHRETREAERIARALARVLASLEGEDIARAFLAGMEER